jgi:hypothetical protein
MNPSRRRLLAFCSLFTANQLLPISAHAEGEKPQCLEKTLTKGKWVGNSSVASINIKSISSKNSIADLAVADGVVIHENGSGLNIEIITDYSVGDFLFKLHNPFYNFDYAGDKIRFIDDVKSQSVSVNGTVQNESSIRKGIVFNGKLQHVYSGLDQHSTLDFTFKDFEKLTQYDSFDVTVIYKNKVMYRRTYFTQEIKSILKELEQFHNAEIKRKDQGQCKAACFITTAACEVVGLQDDCFELRALRSFRDTYLAKTECGAVEIQQYYNLAPMVLDAMKESGVAKGEFLKLYWFSIVPSVIFTYLGLNQLTHWMYKRMMKNLVRQWL